MKTALVIGGGFAGCAMAHQFALQGGWDVTLVEAGSSLGAGVRTQWLGGHPHTFGPRHFLTQREDIWNFMNKYVPLRRLDHEFISYVESDQQFYQYPIHEDDIPKMPEADEIKWELTAEHGSTVGRQIGDSTNFEEFWIRSVGPTLYNKFINSYSKKMWQIESNTELDTFNWSPKGTTLKSGPRAGWDTALSGYPLASNGYDDYFDLATADATVVLNTRIERASLDEHQRAVKIDGHWEVFDAVVSTLAPDELFHNTLGRLAFVGRDITRLVLPVEFALPAKVYFCYYNSGEPYTRVTEYKKFTQHKSDSTLITLEYPSNNGRLYPLPIKSEQAKAKAYFEMMPSRVFSIGRAGSYDYAIDIDDCITQAMNVMEKL